MLAGETEAGVLAIRRVEAREALEGLYAGSDWPADAALPGRALPCALAKERPALCLASLSKRRSAG